MTDNDVGYGTEENIALTPDIVGMNSPYIKPLTAAINRLDRPCSGIIMYAKNAQAATSLCDAFAERLVGCYVCRIRSLCIR